MFNRTRGSNNPLKGAQVHKNDTRLFSPRDIPLALVLLTRLPLPRLPDEVFARQAQAVWAFPLAGLVVGLLAGLVGWVASGAGLPPWGTAALIAATLTIVTGAMHEDGLADTADGLWGGYSAERRLEIMKDSHIGTFGVLALVFSQFMRVAAIVALLSGGGLAGLVAAAVVSRAMMPPLMAGLPNARGAGLSHRVGAPSGSAVIAGLVLACILGAVLAGWPAIAATVCAGLAAMTVAAVAKAKIGGQTGDVLGATQQVCEIVFLLVLAAAV